VYKRTNIYLQTIVFYLDQPRATISITILLQYCATIKKEKNTWKGRSTTKLLDAYLHREEGKYKFKSGTASKEDHIPEQESLFY
jgi:hypothetical protein